MGQFELEASVGLSTATRADVTDHAPVCVGPNEDSVLVRVVLCEHHQPAARASGVPLLRSGWNDFPGVTHFGRGRVPVVVAAFPAQGLRLFR